MTDEEYVKAHLERVDWRSDEDRGTRLFVGFKEFGVKNSVGNTELYLTPAIEAQIWAAAAEFTREREEQIRQLKRQIEWCDAGLSKWHDPIYWHWDENEREEESVVRTRASNAREDVTGRLIVARLESALADLRKGMKA